MKHVMIIAPTFSRWRAMYQLPRDKVTVLVEQNRVRKSDTTTPRVVLLGNEFPTNAQDIPWLMIFRKLEQELVRLKEKYTVKAPIPGARIAPQSKMADIMYHMFGLTVKGVPQYEPNRQPQSIAYRLRVAADEFADNWYSIRERLERRHAAIWDLLDHKVPRTPEEIRRKFGLTLVPIELKSTVAEIDTMDVDTLREYAHVFQQSVHEKLNEMVELVVREPRQQLVDAISELQALMARDGRITHRSFKPIERAIEKMRAFEFVMDEQSIRMLDDLKDRLMRTNPAGLSSSELTSAFGKAIDAIKEDFENEQRTQELISRYGEAAERAVMM